MWATDGASTLGAGVAVLLLAGSVLGAPATPPAVTDADIERARQQHRKPTEAELARGPIPGAPRIENLPQPVTRIPIDIEAISKGFNMQNGAEATLQRLVDQAARAGATLALRGLVNGSIRDTVTRMQALIGSRRVAVQIDSEAFDRDQIVKTPTFVFVHGAEAIEVCSSSTRCLSDVGYAKSRVTSRLTMPCGS